MLRNITPNRVEIVASIIRWVMLAARTLSLPELVAAVGQHIPRHLDLEQTARDCITLCNPLIVIHGEKITLLHQSAKDYFFRHNEDKDPVLEKFSIKAGDGHLILAETCIRGLDGRSALAAYARSHWPEHARQCADNEKLLITRNEPFFAKSSRLRERWWRQYIMLDMGNNSELRSSRKIPRLHMACYLGLKQWADIILVSMWRLSRPWRINQSWSLKTPLCVAIVAGHASLVEYLLAQGADPNSGMLWNENRPLEYAARFECSHDIITTMLSYGANVDVLLYASIRFCNEVQTMDLALKHGADINRTCGVYPLDGMNPIGLAIMMWERARFYHISEMAPRENARRLLQAGVNPLARDYKGNTAIQYAKHDILEDVRSLFKEFGYNYMRTRSHGLREEELPLL